MADFTNIKNSLEVYNKKTGGIDKKYLSEPQNFVAYSIFSLYDQTESGNSLSCNFNKRIEYAEFTDTEEEYNTKISKILEYARECGIDINKIRIPGYDEFLGLVECGNLETLANTLIKQDEKAFFMPQICLNANPAEQGITQNKLSELYATGQQPLKKTAVSAMNNKPAPGPPDKPEEPQKTLQSAEELYQKTIAEDEMAPDNTRIVNNDIHRHERYVATNPNWREDEFNQQCLNLINEPCAAGQIPAEHEVVPKNINPSFGGGLYKNTPIDYMTPGFAISLVPDELSPFFIHDEYLDNMTTTQAAMAKLPKHEDGTYDTDRIRGALLKSIMTIEEMNNASKDKLNYGRYKEFFNNADLTNLILGFEAAGIFEELGIAEEIKVSSPIGILNTLCQKLNTENSETIDNLCEKFDLDKDTVNGILDMVRQYGLVQDSGTVINQIDNDNYVLEELLDIDLSSEEGIEQLMERYRELTGTAFSYPDIAAFSEDNYKLLDKDQQRKQFIQTFGIKPFNNAMEAQKNNMATSALYSGIFKIALPNALGKIPYAGPFLKTFIPLQAELTNQLTTGLEDGEWINWDKLTVENLTEIAVDGFIYAVINNTMSGGGLFNTFKKGGSMLKFLNKSSWTRWMVAPLIKLGKNSKIGDLISNGADSGIKAGIESGIKKGTAWLGGVCNMGFSKDATILERTGSFTANLATGGVFLTLIVVDRVTESKRATDS